MVERLAFVAGSSGRAERSLEELAATYGNVPVDEAEVVVVLGGDGTMLESMHRYASLGAPLFGMNRGSVGFLMNSFSDDDLVDRITRAQAFTLHPLRMTAHCEGNTTHDALAFNEVSMLRQSRQAGKLRIYVNGRERMRELVCDGVLVSTTAGSTAYNLSAHGPIIPIGSPLLALTPISAFRPRRWRGALLPNTSHVKVEVLERWKRPMAAVADFAEARNVIEVDIREDPDVSVELLFDADHNLEERILAEQFGA